MAILALLLVVKLNRIKPFDPSESLSSHASSIKFDTHLVSLIALQGIRGPSVVHLSPDSPCYCNSLSKRFTTPLMDKMGDPFVFHELTLEGELRELIPSYPAIIVIDDEQQLRYLGPYASGIGCWVGKGDAEKIAEISRTTHYYGAIINAQVSGCYCSVK